MEDRQKRFPIYKVIATDVDGTLMNSKHELQNATAEALNDAIENGVQVIVVTGKAKGIWWDEVASKVKLQGFPSVFLQGLLVCDGNGEVIHNVYLDNETLHALVDFADEKSLPIALYSGTRLFVSSFNDRVEKLLPFKEPMPSAVGPLKAFISGGANLREEDNLHRDLSFLPKINKVVFLLTPEEAKTFRVEIEAICHFTQRATVTQALDWAIEVIPSQANKGAGLAIALKSIGVEGNEVIAFGDGENDITMFKMVGMSCAMGNSMQSLKEFANDNVPSNDEDGIAYGIEKHLYKS